jgi:hypothetical protein
LGQAEEALDDAQRALKIQETAFAHFMCALGFNAAGEVDRARKHAKAGAKLDSEISCIDGCDGPWAPGWLQTLRSLIG